MILIKLERVLDLKIFRRTSIKSLSRTKNGWQLLPFTSLVWEKGFLRSKIFMSRITLKMFEAQMQSNKETGKATARTWLYNWMIDYSRVHVSTRDCIFTFGHKDFVFGLKGEIKLKWRSTSEFHRMTWSSGSRTTRKVLPTQSDFPRVICPPTYHQEID